METNPAAKPVQSGTQAAGNAAQDADVELGRWLHSKRKVLKREELGAGKDWLHEALSARSSVRIRYWAGTTPGESRVIRPREFFRVLGYDWVYLLAHDERHDENRTFRVEFIEADTAEE